MFLEILALLILVFIIVSSLLLARYSSSSSKKDRELSRSRDERTVHQIRRLEQTARQVITTEQLIMDHLLTLDDKLNAVVRVVDEHSTIVNEQMRIIQSLVNSDMLTARRDELRRTKELKLAMERLVSSATLSRQQPEGQDLLALEHIENRIKELETVLADQSN